jgi:hypothetical protein
LPIGKPRNLYRKLPSILARATGRWSNPLPENASTTMDALVANP